LSLAELFSKVSARLDLEMSGLDYVTGNEDTTLDYVTGNEDIALDCLFGV
jgi:hypothetical protein